MSEKLAFLRPTQTEIPRLSGLFSRPGEFSCELTTASMVIWQSTFDFAYCQVEDMLFYRTRYGGRTRFGIPFAADLPKAMALLTTYCTENNLPLVLTAAEGGRLTAFCEAFGDAFEYTENRDLAEYIYSYDSLATLAGKRYHGKRNHLSAFNRQYAWCYEPLCKDNVEEVLSMTERWYEENADKTDEWLTLERIGSRKVLENMDELLIKGGVIRVDGRIAAVTFGCPVNDCVFDVNYEKALGAYDGLYTAINHAFVTHELSGYRYINREDDMGLPGMRKAKLSYHPEILLKKFVITQHL